MFLEYPVSARGKRETKEMNIEGRVQLDMLVVTPGLQKRENDIFSLLGICIAKLSTVNSRNFLVRRPRLDCFFRARWRSTLLCAL